MKKECLEKICERFEPAFRGWGKTNMVTSMFFLSLDRCMETDEERAKFRGMLEELYGEE